jgi:hypothetical protein
MFPKIFYKATIYDKYRVYKLFYFLSHNNKHIEFITKRLIKSGLEDVPSLDYKWHNYFPKNGIKCQNVNYWNVNYLNFIVEIAMEHHKNRDNFIRIVDIESVN